jgi:uncharacterized protein involved in exopolysaccharide biosynthesis
LKSSENSLRELSDPIPLDFLQIALRRWWVIILAMCLGGLLGMGLHLLILPVYQAQSVISAGVDFVKTGRLTDVEEDYMIKKVGDLIKSDIVIDQVITEANDRGIQITRQDFDNMHYLQRSFNDWLLVVRSRDANQAASLSSLWADTAWSELSQATGHLVKLDEYQTYLDSQIRCRDLQLTTSVGSVCYLESAEHIDTQINETLALMESERLAANGLVDGVVFNLTETASVPTEPQILGRGSLILAGTLLGGLLAGVYLFVWGMRNPR